MEYPKDLRDDRERLDDENKATKREEFERNHTEIPCEGCVREVKEWPRQIAGLMKVGFCSICDQKSETLICVECWEKGTR